MRTDGLGELLAPHLMCGVSKFHRLQPRYADGRLPRPIGGIGSRGKKL